LNLQSGGTFPAIRGFFCEGAGNTASIVGVYPIDNIGNQYGLRLVLTPTMVHQYISTDSGATWIEISAVPRQPGWVGIPAVGISSLHCGGVALNASKFNAVPFPPLKPTVAMQSYWTTFDLKFMQTTAPAGTLIPDISAHTFWVSYSYGSAYLGESSGSSGLEHIVPHVDLPGPFDLLGGITKWSLIRVIKLKGYKIKGVKIYFPPGCRNYVKIKLMYNGNSWIPEENYSDPIQGDGRIIYIPANRVISPNDYIEVWYRNLDVSPHRLDIQLDIHNDRTNSMIQDDPSERRLGRETESFIETYEDEGD
jgi:hypothetical protein